MGSLRIVSEFDPAADLVLFQGDCLDLLAQIPAGLVSLIVTSPPYNLGKPYERRLDLDEYLAQQGQVIEGCVRVLDERGSICWQVGNYVHNGEIISASMRSCSTTWRNFSTFSTKARPIWA